MEKVEEIKAEGLVRWEEVIGDLDVLTTVLYTPQMEKI